MMNWVHAAPSILSAFMASLVEGVEALTVVLAVGSTRGWRQALTGVALGLGVLVALTAAVGPALVRVPLDTLQLVVGTLLLLFGMRWLRKAVLRAAGIIPLHDETAAYAKQRAALATSELARSGWDHAAIFTAFQIVMLEGIEVVFIVVAIGSTAHLLAPAALGAGAALALVVALGLIVHRPLARVPENALKFIVGILLTAFGTFWTGEGVGLAWPGGDWVLLLLIIVYGALASGLVVVARTIARPGFESGRTAVRK